MIDSLILAKMDPVQGWTLGIALVTFAVYIGIAIWSKASSSESDPGSGRLRQRRRPQGPSAPALR